MINELKYFVYETLIPFFIALIMAYFIASIIVKAWNNVIYNNKLEQLESEYKIKKCELYNGIYVNNVCIKEENFINID